MLQATDLLLRLNCEMNPDKELRPVFCVFVERNKKGENFWTHSCDIENFILC